MQVARLDPAVTTGKGASAAATATKDAQPAARVAAGHLHRARAAQLSERHHGSRGHVTGQHGGTRHGRAATGRRRAAIADVRLWRPDEVDDGDRSRDALKLGGLRRLRGHRLRAPPALLVGLGRKAEGARVKGSRLVEDDAEPSTSACAAAATAMAAATIAMAEGDEAARRGAGWRHEGGDQLAVGRPHLD